MRTKKNGVRGVGIAGRALLASSVVLVGMGLPSQGLAADATASSVIAWGITETAKPAHAPVDIGVLTSMSAYESRVLAITTSGGLTGWWRSESHGHIRQDIPPGLPAIGVASGWGHDLVLRNDGTVEAWGVNHSGQLDVPAGLTDVTAVAAGHRHSLALRNDGTVVAWGADECGQATVPPDLRTVVAVSAGRYHSAALLDDGTVHEWGGHGHRACETTGVPEGLSGVTAISSSGDYSVALLDDGTVEAWGEQDGTRGSLVPEGLDDVVAVDAGPSHAVALRDDGTVVAWRYGEDGVLDLPDHLRDVSLVEAGADYSLALATTIPGAPASVAATTGAGYADVKWGAPYSGANTVTSYEVRTYRDGVAVGEPIIADPMAGAARPSWTSRSVIVPGLHDGVA